MGTPILRGERVWLRIIDKADMVSIDIDDRDLGHYAGFKFSFSADMADGWLAELRTEMMAGTAYQFSICPLGSREAIGGAGLRGIDQATGSAWVSIFLADPARWGGGLGTDAMNVLLDFGFGELRLERVALEVFDYNERAIASYRKAGYVEEARRRRARFHRGVFHDVVTMAIVRADWEAQARARSWDLPALADG